MSQQTTALVHGSRTSGAAHSFLRAALQTQTQRLVILEIDHHIDRRAAPANALWHTPDDYATEGDAARIDADANAIAGHWHEHFRADPSDWDGLSLATVVRSELALLLIPILKTIYMISQLIEVERPARILLGNGLSLDRWAARQVARRRGVGVDELPLDPAARIEPQWDARASQAPGRSALKRGLAAFTAPIAGSGAVRADMRRARLAHQIGRPIVLSFDDFTAHDPRHVDLCGTNQFAFMPLYRRAPLGRFLRRRLVKPRYAKLFSRRWPQVEMTLAPLPLTHYCGVALWPALRPWFHKQFTDAFPYFAAEGATMRRRIEQLRPAMLLAPWVVQGRCALAIELARAMAIPVGVLQTYWCPGRAYPGNMRDHLHADHFFLWSAISKTWCDHPSRVSAQCHFVRHPSYSLPERPSHATSICKAETLDSGARRQGQVGDRKSVRAMILLTAQYWGPWTSIHAPKDTDDLWTAFIAAARACPEFDFVGKLHPNMNADGHEGSSGAQRLINALPQPLPANFRLAPFRSDIREWLDQADVIVTYYSTTTIEAALAGKWLVLLNLSGKRDFLPEASEDGYAQPVYASYELPATIRRILNDVELQKRMEAGRQKYLKRAIAPGRDTSEVLGNVLRGRCACPVCAERQVLAAPRIPKPVLMTRSAAVEARAMWRSV